VERDTSPAVEILERLSFQKAEDKKEARGRDTLFLMT
jgi:hypothetical protein